MIHSGSRNIGYKIAHYFHKTAVSLCDQWFSDIPTSNLSFFPYPGVEAQQYLIAMNWALQFAKENRKRIASSCMNAFLEHIPAKRTFTRDIHHNYVAIENHFNENVWVHRKGATSARENEIGIIPGSQGTKSYIVRGLGNPESFMSCSHGAGRKMGRNEAQRKLDVVEQKRLLEEQGIIHSIRGKKDLDEAPGAYKDIGMVMEDQKDLVEVVVELSPLGVVKG